MAKPTIRIRWPDTLICFRNLFKQALAQEAPDALAQLSPAISKQRWVIQLTRVGYGQHALAYLSRYVFKTATANRRLPQLPDGRLRWFYRHSRTR